MAIRPARATLGLPQTGAASNAVPSRSAVARISAETSIDTVDASIRSDGARVPSESRPCGPATTSTKSFESETVVMTMSRSARSTGRLTTCAPSFASDSVLAGVRLYTVTSTPRRSSRVTSAAPIRPVPIQPKRWLFVEGVVIDALSVPPACANVCLPPSQPLFSLSNRLLPHRRRGRQLQVGPDHRRSAHDQLRLEDDLARRPLTVFDLIEQQPGGHNPELVRRDMDGGQS